MICLVLLLNIVAGYVLCLDLFYRTGKCKDIDECAVNGGTGDCQQVCTNSVGSYKCGCRSGFQLKNDRYCVDIDECSIPSLNKCQHTCENNIGR